MTDKKAITPAAVRKRRQRKNQQKDGLYRHEIALNEKENDILEYIRHHRNPGRDPYDRNELIALLLLCDFERLKRQEARLGKCPHCNDELPEGCNSLFKGDSSCWFTRDCRKLNLTSVTGHANIEDE